MAILGAFMAAPLGRSAGIASLAVIIAAISVALFATDGPLSAVVAPAFFVCAYWGAQVLHPNVLAINVGTLGWRKSMVVFLGVLLGSLWLRGRSHARLYIVWLLILACLVSIAIHLWFPSFERSILRSADQYTSEFGGVARMQGIFAGPFHAAMAGSFLVLFGIYSILDPRKRKLAWISLLVGIVTIDLSLVRTAYVVVAVGLVIGILSKAVRDGVRKSLSVILWGSLGVLLFGMAADVQPILTLFSGNDVLTSLISASDDTRFEGRFDTWEQAWVMIQDNPLFGAGAGSAGDTLGAYFLPGGHVTSHNVVVKYLVEGGVVGLVLVGFAVFVLAKSIRRESGATPEVVASCVCLIGFGLTGSSVEAVPVSFVLAILLGLAARGDNSSDNSVEEKGVSDQPRRRSFIGS